MITTIFMASLLSVSHPSAVRFITASSCDATPVNLSIGMSTQLIFEEAPVLTYNGDEQTFVVRTTEDIPRSVVIKPTITPESLAQLMGSQRHRSQREVISGLNQTYSTNLFVFFKNSNQLLFRLQLVDKGSADNIIRIRQSFKKDCNL